MTRRPGLLPIIAALLLALPATAQDRPAAPRGGGAPPPPAAVPPAPARLEGESARPPQPLPPLPPGIEAMPEGPGWRVPFVGEARLLDDPAVLAALSELGRRMSAAPRGRVTLLAQVSAPAGDVSAARRIALARALSVKNALVAGGLDETRIDVRPLGRTAAALDAVDIIPPEAQPSSAP